MTDSIYVYLEELPDGVNEAVLTCQGGYTIYIDPRQSEEGIKRSYRHAMMHIKHNDFFRSDVQSIESEAHRKE